VLQVGALEGERLHPSVPVLPGAVGLPQLAVEADGGVPGVPERCADLIVQPEVPVQEFLGLLAADRAYQLGPQPPCGVGGRGIDKVAVRRGGRGLHPGPWQEG